MTTAIDDMPAMTATDDSGSTEEEIRNRVCAVLGAIYPGGDLVERRNDQRYPYPYLIRLIPVDKDGTLLESETVVAVGKHLSERGLGFYHPHPLPYRRMAVALDAVDGAESVLLVDLAWCRFTRQGWYESGGRFLSVASDPSAEYAA